MNLSAQTRQGQLAVEPAAAAVATASGELAAVEARLELRLSPRPMKGVVEVASGDSAFSIVQVREVRRAERWMTLEVSGVYSTAEPRAVTLTYMVDGLSAKQTVTFSPSTPLAAPPDAPPSRTSQRYVPFEDDEERASANDVSPAVIQPTGVTLSTPETTRDDGLAIEIAPAMFRIATAFAELLAAAIVMTVVMFVVIFVAAGPMVAICGEDPVPGTGCATADSVIVNSLTAYILLAIPLYHAITTMIGGGIAYRLMGLRIVCRGAWLARPLREEVDRMRPGFLRGLLRTLLFYFGALCFALGHLWIFTNPERRGWHDLGAGTLVVRARR
jgi:uncharacterized RDD family membrane protein YckC